MDDLARHNRDRWDALARAGVSFAQSMLDLDADAARRLVDPYGILGDVRGKEVLCLASGGSQQSVAFALLGARATVLDLSDEQLDRDRAAAAHYGVTIDVVQGDMRDLSRFADGRFDVVWHAYSINFVPEALPVLREAARVLAPGGYYRIEFANPFVFEVDERSWTGDGYLLRRPYVDGAEMEDTTWVIARENGTTFQVEGPREFRHLLSSVVNGMVAQGFVLLGLWEAESPDPNAAPGTWDHFAVVAPPFLTIWAVLRPDALRRLTENATEGIRRAERGGPRGRHDGL
jgi:ubiquinone/menaquinone biosynthesis C-methylase UbiE